MRQVNYWLGHPWYRYHEDGMWVKLISEVGVICVQENALKPGSVDVWVY